MLKKQWIIILIQELMINIPSQRRYVEYFSLAFLNSKGIPPYMGQSLKLKKIKMSSCPKNGISNFGLKIKDINGNTFFDYIKLKKNN